MAVGPGGITVGSYSPQDLTQEQRQWLWQQFGHNGEAPVGYGGEGAQMNYSNDSGASIQFPTFDFNLEEAQRQSYEALKPFYEKIISFAQGDLDLAKRILQYTYDQGMRESKQEYGSSSAEAQRLTAEETPQLLTTQNRRGILESGFGQQERQRLGARQTARAEAIDRAYENRTGRLAQEKEFGTQQEQQNFEKTKFGTERERRQEAQQMAQTEFGIKQSQYQTQLAKAQRDEAERLSNLQGTTLGEFYTGYTDQPILSNLYTPSSTEKPLTGFAKVLADTNKLMYG